MNSTNDDSMRANDAHQEYLAETKRLVDQEIESLFALITEAIAQSSAAASSGQPPAVTRDARVMRVANGARTATFEIEAITDLPDDADRADSFPTSQARCSVQRSDGETEQWELHRIGAGNASPGYTWMFARTETPVNEEAIARSLQSLFA